MKIIESIDKYLNEQSSAVKIQNAMYQDKKIAKKIADMLDISPDPDDAGEQLSAIDDKQLMNVIKKLKI